MLRPGPNSAPTHLLAGFSVERKRLRERERKGQQGEKERRSRRGKEEGTKRRVKGGREVFCAVVILLRKNPVVLNAATVNTTLTRALTLPADDDELQRSQLYS